MDKTSEFTPSPILPPKSRVVSPDPDEGTSYDFMLERINACNSAAELRNLITKSKRSLIFEYPQALRAIRRKLDDFEANLNSRDIALLLFSFHKSDHCGPRGEDLRRAIFASMAEMALDHVHEASARDISMIVHVVARCDYCPNRVEELLFEQAVNRGITVLNDFTPEGLSNMLFGLAIINNKQKNFYSFEFFDRAAKVAISIMDLFCAESLARMANAYAQIGHCDVELVRAVAKEAIPLLKVGAFQRTSDLVSLIDAFGTFWYDFELSDDVYVNTVLCEAAMAASDPPIDMRTISYKQVGRLAVVYSRKMYLFSKRANTLFHRIVWFVAGNPAVAACWDTDDLITVTEAFAVSRIQNDFFILKIDNILAERQLDAANIKRLVSLGAGWTIPPMALVFECIFRGFMNLDESEIPLSLAMGIAKLLPFGQQKEILPYGIWKRVLDLTMKKGADSDVQEVFGSFAKLAPLGLDGMLMGRR